MNVKGKALFKEGNHRDSVRVFETLIETDPYSPQVVESMSFLVESYFLMGRYVKCLTTIEKLVDLYPKRSIDGKGTDEDG